MDGHERRGLDGAVYRRISARKLVPCSSGATPKTSATVWPRSANVARVPRSTPARTRRASDEQRHVLARVIGRRRRRIVAVIGRDDEQIVGREARQQRAPAARRTARGWRRSPATSLRWPYCVSKSTRFAKIEPVGVVGQLRVDDVHAVVVATSCEWRASARARRTDPRSCRCRRRHGPRRDQPIEQRRRRTARARSRADWPCARSCAGLADERPRDDAADAHAARDQLEGDAAHVGTARRSESPPRARRSETRCRPTCRRSARRCARAPAPARR